MVIGLPVSLKTDGDRIALPTMALGRIAGGTFFSWISSNRFDRVISVFYILPVEMTASKTTFTPLN
jgi:hypothetical protein